MIQLSEAIGEPTMSRGTILIVDDEQDLLQIMEAIFSEAGLKCMSANKASAALDILTRHMEIDVIVSDLRMPEMDGLQFLEKIRSDYIERSWLQFLFVTGHGTLESAIKAMKLQATDFIHKPIRRAELLKAVDAAMERSKKQRKAAEIKQNAEAALSRLSGDITRISDALGITSLIPPEGTTEADYNAIPSNSGAKGNVGKEERSDERVLEFVKAINLRNELFEEEIFIEPVWRILFFLMENSLMGNELSLTELYSASGVSPATAGRRVAELKDAGFVAISNDGADKRRQKVSLSADALQRLKQYINGIAKI